MSKARELAELSRTVSDSADATAITINSSEEVTFADDIFLGDGKKALFGADSDLQIYHDGSNSYIKDYGAGRLHILSATDFLIANTANTQNFIYAVESGAVNLYYSGSRKFETTSTGIDVTGSVTADDLIKVQNAAGSSAAEVDIVSGSTWRIRSNPTSGTNSYGFDIVKGSAGTDVKMSIDSSGNLMVGTQDSAPAVSSSEVGVAISGGSGYVAASRSNSASGFFNRLSDGDILALNKDGALVGSLGAYASRLYVGNDDTFLTFEGAADKIYPATSTGAGRDNAIDLGGSTARFKDLHLSGTANVGGSVGINTTIAPVRTLDVKGSVNFSVNTPTHETFVFTTGAVNDAKLLMQNASSATTVQLQANGDSYFNGGNVGIGESSALGKLHIKTADSGASVDSSANELVVEGSGNAGITILSGQSSSGNIYFGDAGVNWDGYIAYSQASRKFVFGAAAGTNTLEIDSNGALIGGSATMNGKAGTSPIFEMINNDNEDNDTGRETSLRFSGHRSGGEDVINAQISGHHHGNADNDNGMLFFYTNNGSGLTLAQKIDSGQNVINPTEGAYNQVSGASGKAWAYGSTGDSSIPGTASATFGFHHWNGSSWSQPVALDSDGVKLPSGKGIKFAGHSSANILDDYEEGTWTPTLIAGTTNPTGGGAQSPVGAYTKIGNRVFVTFYVGRSYTNSPSGLIYISGLPFTILNSSQNNAFFNVSTYNIDFGSSGVPFGIPQQNTQTVGFYAMSSNSGWGGLEWQNHANGTIFISGQFSYIAA